MHKSLKLYNDMATEPHQQNSFSSCSKTVQEHSF